MMDRAKAFFAAPYHTDMDALDWMLFVGLFIFAAILWNMVFRHIAHGIEA